LSAGKKHFREAITETVRRGIFQNIVFFFQFMCIIISDGY